jgi:hypothetical protein
MMTSQTPTINVHYGPESDAVSIGEDGAPLLTYQRHPEHGFVWVLYYLDGDGGVGDHVIPGDLTEVDEVVKSAATWLRLQDGA